MPETEEKQKVKMEAHLSKKFVESMQKNPHVQHSVIVHVPVMKKSRAGVEYNSFQRVKIPLNNPTPLQKN